MVGSVRNTDVAFAWRGGPLLSLHDQDLVAVRMFRSRAKHQTELAGDGMSVFLGILESKVDHLADVLESTYGKLEQLSRRVLDQTEADLQSDLVALAEVEDQNGKIRLNLVDTQPVLASLHRSDKLPHRVSPGGDQLPLRHHHRFDQHRTEPDRQGPFGRRRRIPAPNPHRQSLRNELPAHARTLLARRVSTGDPADGHPRRCPIPVRQTARLDVAATRRARRANRRVCRRPAASPWGCLGGG